MRSWPAEEDSNGFDGSKTAGFLGVFRALREAVAPSLGGRQVPPPRVMASGGESWAASEGTILAGHDPSLAWCGLLWRRGSAPRGPSGRSLFGFRGSGRGGDANRAVSRHRRTCAGWTGSARAGDTHRIHPGARTQLLRHRLCPSQPRDPGRGASKELKPT